MAHAQRVFGSQRITLNRVFFYNIVETKTCAEYTYMLDNSLLFDRRKIAAVDSYSKYSILSFSIKYDAIERVFKFSLFSS